MALPILPNEKKTGVDPHIASAGTSFMHETNNILHAQSEVLGKILTSLDNLTEVVKKGFDELNANLMDQEQSNKRKDRLNELSDSENSVEKKPNAFQVVS